MNIFIQIITNKYLYVPILVWIAIQTFKVIWDLIETKKFNFKRLFGAGGMPSSHSAVVMCLAVMIGRGYGFDTPIFALSVIFASVVMYDAAGVRRAAGKQAALLNKIVNTPGLSIPEVQESIKEEIKNQKKDENYEAPSINQNLDDKLSAEDEEERIPPIKEPVHQEAEPLGEDTVITVLDDIKIGLNNIGATCYMNSTIQCLSNTKELTYYFLNKFNPKDKNKIISNEFYEVLKCLWNQEKNNKPYSPTHFKEVISKENPLFEGVQACDSKDLINFLLERMHQELNIKKMI